MAAPMKIGADMCLSQVGGRAVFVPRAKGSRFGTRETQIELNGHFCGLRTAFPQVVNRE